MGLGLPGKISDGRGRGEEQGRLMGRERGQERMATCAHHAGVWLLPKRHTLLKSRTKPWSSTTGSFLQLPVALFSDHPSTTAIPISLLFASP